MSTWIESTVLQQYKTSFIDRLTSDQASLLFLLSTQYLLQYWLPRLLSTTTGATTAPILRPSVVMLTVGMVTIVEDCDIVEALIGLVIMDSCIDVAVSVVAVVVMAIVVVVTSTAVGTVLIVRTVS